MYRYIYVPVYEEDYIEIKKNHKNKTMLQI